MINLNTETKCPQENEDTSLTNPQST